MAKFYGWTLVQAFFLINLLNVTFPYYGASVINTHMTLALDLDRSVLGLGVTLFSVSLGISSPFVALCITKKGIRFTLICGGILIAGGALLMALAVTKAWHYVFVFGVIIGSGVGLGGVIPIQTGINHWFRKRRALAMSIVLCAPGAGALIAALMLDRVISASNGNWKAGWLLVAATSLLAIGLSAAFVKDKPSDMGQVPDGFLTVQNPGDTTKTGSFSGRAYQSIDNWKSIDALKTRAFWLIVIASISFIAPYSTHVSHGMIHLRDLGHSDTTATFSIALMVFFATISNLVVGFIGDRVEPRLIWSASLCLVFAGSIVGIEATNNYSIFLYALLVGGGMGGAYVCLATILGNYFGANSFAPIMSIIFSITVITSAFAPFLAGIVYDSYGSYTAAFYGVAAVALLGAISVLFALPPIPEPLAIPEES